MIEGELASMTPGEMPKEESLTEYSLSRNQLAKAIGISSNQISDNVNNQSTADHGGNRPSPWFIFSQ